mgnify:CR=1 FL=1
MESLGYAVQLDDVGLYGLKCYTSSGEFNKWGGEGWEVTV